MFSFLRKKEAQAKIIDRIFISSKAKTNAIVEKIQNQNNTSIICWFDESHEQLNKLIQSNNLTASIYMARETLPHNVLVNPIVFVEHHPSGIKEKELLEKLRTKEVIFYSALDEPLFKHFGGDKIILMMEKLGLSENEAIEHPMISAAIKNAQEKISKGLVIEHSAQSQADWFSKNIVK
jgi:hypothetical protein